MAGPAGCVESYRECEAGGLQRYDNTHLDNRYDYVSARALPRSLACPSRSRHSSLCLRALRCNTSIISGVVVLRAHSA